MIELSKNKDTTDIPTCLVLVKYFSSQSEIDIDLSA